MIFDVTARQYGNTVHFDVEVDSLESAEESDVLKRALKEAKSKAAEIFEYKGTGDEPKVSVKQAKEQGVAPSSISND